jgi:PKD repeat protein
MKKFLYNLLFTSIIILGAGFSNLSLAQKYCYPSFSTGCSGGDSILYFSAGSYSRYSGCSSGGLDTSKVGTSNFTLYRGKSYSVTITAGANESFGLYIDYNKNGSFADPAELVTDDDNGSFSTITQTISIPIDAPAGLTRMRILVATGANTVDYNTSCSSSYTKGEVEDYSFTIGAYANDVAIMTLITPQNLSCPSSKEKVQILLRNVGTNTLSNIPFVISYGSTTINSTYTRPLISNSQDTFTVGYINASSNGTYNFKVYSNLSGDGDRGNDTISAAIDIKQPLPPAVTTNISHCGPGSVYLYGASKSPSSTTYWFNSSTASTAFATGDSILLPFLKVGQSGTYYAESRYQNANSLQKGSYSTAKANYGNMFDVYAKTSVSLDSFDVNFSTTGSDSAIIYYRLGSYSGYERSPSSWTKLGTFYCNGQGYGRATRVSMPTGLPLQIGSTYGFYIIPYTGQAYYDVTTTSTNPKSNNELSISAGASLASNFASGTGGSGSTVITLSRDWNGSLYYHYSACNSARVSSTITMLQNPTGSAISKGSPFMGSYLSGTKKDPDQVCMGDTNTYVLTPPTGMSNSDFGTKWIVSALSFATSTGTTIKDTIMRLPTATKSGYMKFFPSSLADSVFILKVTMKIPASGCDSTLIRYIKINAQPKAAFTIANGCMGKVMAITNSSTPTGSNISYKWAFGNGDSATGATPAYKYFSTGTYTVTLVTINGPCSSTATKTVTVYPAPYGSNFSKGTPFSGSMNTGDIFDPDNVCLTDTNTYQITAPKGLSNSDYGTKWTITGMTFASIYGTKLTDTLFKKPTAIKNASFSFFPSKYVDSIFLLKFTLRTLPGNCDSVMTRYIHVRVKPSAYYSFTNACIGSPITFKDTSKAKPSSIVAWQWNFGDASTTNTQNPAHAYTKAGKFNTTLTVTTDVGCSGSVTKSVEQYPRPGTKFGAALGCNTLPTNFIDSTTITSGTVTAWKWSFGDGGTSTLQNPSHIYVKSGPYNVKLITTSSFGCKDSLTKRIRILPKPHAIFGFKNVCVGATVFFGNTSTDSTNKTTYNWDFGDGKTSTVQNGSHAYTANGTYKVLLTVTSGNGCTDTVSHIISPYVDPVPKITTNAPACIGNTVSMIDSGVSPAGSYYTWDFGDGTAQYISNKSNAASHAYAKAGSYNVNVNILTGGGCADSQKISITIADFPTPGFTASTVCIGKSTVFTNTSTGADTFAWDFGDGTKPVTTKNASHLYTKAGPYIVKLGAASKLGCADSIVKTINVIPLPVVGKWVRKQTGYTVTFVPQDSTIGNFKWYFGTTTNDSSSLKKPTFTYPTADGKYAVKEVVTNSSGCSSFRIDTVYMGKYAINEPGNDFGGVSVYPNPFEGTTNIYYNLTERSKVTIKVFDAQGKEVAQLKDGFYAAGSYNDAFDARKYNAGEGMYFLKMYVNDKYFTTKIVNMK